MTNRRSRRRLLLLAIGAIALLGLVAAAACNDDDGGGGGGGNGDPTATMSDGNDNGNGSAPTATMTDDNGNDGGSSLDDLANFTSDYEAFEGMVTYVIDFTGNEGGLSSMTIYQKGGSSRFDVSTDEGDVAFISTPDATFLCADSQCLQYPAEDSTASAGVDAFVSLLSAETITQEIDNIPNDVDVSVPDETIAGIDGTCFTYSGDLDPAQAGDESGQFCFSDGGLLLRLTFADSTETGSFEATSASDDVPDSAFEPMFPVTDLSDLFPTQ